MSDLIRRGEALEALKWMSVEDTDAKTVQRCIEAISNMPSADAVSVRHGKWIDYDDEGYVECPYCGSCTNSDGNIKELHYCFNCGARMDSERKDND